MRISQGNASCLQSLLCFPLQHPSLDVSQMSALRDDDVPTETDTSEVRLRDCSAVPLSRSFTERNDVLVGALSEAYFVESSDNSANLEDVLEQVLAGPHAAADLHVDVAVEREEEPGVIVDNVSIVSDNVPLNGALRKASLQ